MLLWLWPRPPLALLWEWSTSLLLLPGLLLLWLLPLEPLPLALCPRPGGQEGQQGQEAQLEQAVQAQQLQSWQQQWQAS